MIEVSEEELLKMINTELKKMPNYFDGLEITSVETIKGKFVFRGNGFSDDKGQVNPNKLEIAEQLINEVSKKLELGSTHIF